LARVFGKISIVRQVTELSSTNRLRANPPLLRFSAGQGFDPFDEASDFGIK
jgi:hypothetical protein